MGFNPAIPIEHAEPADHRARSATCSRSVPTASPRVGGARRRSSRWGPTWPIRYGLYDARGYDYPVERRYDRLWRATAGPGGDLIPPTAFAVPTRQGDADAEPPERDRPAPGARRRAAAAAGPPAAPTRARTRSVYRNANALPRAFMVDSQRTVRGEDAAMGAVMDGDVDLRDVAVTERRVPGLAEAGAAIAGRPARGQRPPGGLRARGGRGSRRRRGGRRCWCSPTCTSRAGRRAWTAARCRARARELLLRGVPLAAGDHSVELRYEPASWRAGWIVSLLGCLILVALTALGLRGRRRARSR